MGTLGWANSSAGLELFQAHTLTYLIIPVCVSVCGRPARQGPARPGGLDGLAARPFDVRTRLRKRRVLSDHHARLETQKWRRKMRRICQSASSGFQIFLVKGVARGCFSVAHRWGATLKTSPRYHWVRESAIVKFMVLQIPFHVGGCPNARAHPPAVLPPRRMPSSPSGRFCCCALLRGTRQESKGAALQRGLHQDKEASRPIAQGRGTAAEPALKRPAFYSN